MPGGTHGHYIQCSLDPLGTLVMTLPTMHLPWRVHLSAYQSVRAECPEHPAQLFSPSMWHWLWTRGQEAIARSHTCGMTLGLALRGKREPGFLSYLPSQSSYLPRCALKHYYETLQKCGSVFPDVLCWSSWSPVCIQGKILCDFLGEQVRPSNPPQQGSSEELSKLQRPKAIHCINEINYLLSVYICAGCVLAFREEKNIVLLFFVILWVQKRNPSWERQCRVYSVPAAPVTTRQTLTA